MGKFRSKKQPVVSKSSVEAEFWVLTLELCENLWMKRVMKELGWTLSSPIRICCDNVGNQHGRESCPT